MLTDYMLAKNGVANFDFRVELLDKDENFKRVLQNVDVSGTSISFNSLSTAKRTARLSLTPVDAISKTGLYPSNVLYPADDLYPANETIENEVSDIDFLNDRIKIYMVYNNIQTLYPSNTLYPSESLFPSSQAVEYPLGVYLLSNPQKAYTDGIINYDITCYSKLMILSSDRVTETYVVESGERYTDAITTLIESSGITNYYIPSSTKTLSRSNDFELGTTKLEIVQSLLDAINYTSLYTDNDGVVTAQPYVSPADRDVEIEYKDDRYSIISDSSYSNTFDAFNTPNEWIGIVSNAETDPLTSIYQNTNLNSLTSIQNRGRVITAEPLTYTDISDQATLDARVKRQAETDSNIYAYVNFETLANPLSGYLTKIKLQFDNDEGEFIETKWTLNFSGTMTHTIRKVVEI